MNDIFYLNENEIKFVELYKLLNSSLNIFVEYYSKDVIQIRYKSVMYNFTKMDLTEFLDEEDILFISKNYIKTIICISYNSKYIFELIEVIYIILEKYGGIIGNDNIGFLPTYNLDTIKYFS